MTDPEQFIYGETEQPMREYDVVKIADGLGFGEGGISFLDRVDSGEHSHPIDAEIVRSTEEVINSDDILVSVDVDDDGKMIEDDGCGDGRDVLRIFKGKNILKRSLNRAKVFGGGLTMGVAAVIGSGKAAGRKLGKLFSDTIQDFDEHKITFGAHTDNHAEGNNCGCGAIDKSPIIIANAVQFQDEITGAIKLLSGGDYNQEQLNRVFGNYAAYNNQISGEAYSGREVAAEIMDKHKVVKELEGPHLETHVVINTVAGKTVNQGLIRKVTGGKVQVFAVDEWRIRQLADKRYKAGSEEASEAYLSMLVYTLATAATLTKGDLPVYVVSRAQQLVAA